MVTTQTPPDTIEYPVEDGQVVESDAHYKSGMQLVDALSRFFLGRPDVFVGGNIALFYERGNPGKYLGPDVLVAFNVQPKTREERPSYLIWVEGVPPAVIIEWASSKTWQEDVRNKPASYAALGVREYYLYDPLGRFLEPRLQGYHLTAPGIYTTVNGEEIASPALGLDLVLRDGWLRLRDPKTGLLIPTSEEQAATLVAQAVALTITETQLARLQEQEAATAAEIARLQEQEAAAQAEIARLRAELARRDAPEAEES